MASKRVRLMSEIFILHGTSILSSESWDIRAYTRKNDAIDAASALNGLLWSGPRRGRIRGGDALQEAPVRRALAMAGDAKEGGEDLGFANYDVRTVPLATEPPPRERGSLELRLLRILQRPPIRLCMYYAPQDLHRGFGAVIRRGWAFSEKRGLTQTLWLTEKGREAYQALKGEEGGQ